MHNLRRRVVLACAIAAAFAAAACSRSAASARTGSTEANPANLPAARAGSQSPAIAPEDRALPPSQTGGFDGQKAYDFTAKLVSFGPRPPASEAIRHTQDYMIGQLKGFGCQVDTDDFHAPTPVGDLAMKNIIAKIPGKGQGIILLLTHYDTVRVENFVGADDGGSSSGLMLEMARVLCGARERNANAVWIAFLDGEEAQSVINGQAQWSDTDSVYGSRELAAGMAVSGDLKRIRALILADMVGQKNLQIPREPSSTKWLTDLVWKTANRLGHGDVFLSTEDPSAIEDDHGPFLKRRVPSLDIIELNDYQYWHTPQDTMDKISPKSLSIVGHVILASVGELQQKFR